MPPLTVALILFCTAVLLTYGLRVFGRGRARFERLGQAPGSALLPGFVVEAFYWAFQAPGRALASLRVDPDALTYLALALSLASLPVVAFGHLVEGAVCVAAGGILDVLDGLVARLRGRASPSGAVLDSVTDRLADGAPFAGLAVLYRGNPVAMLVPIAALMASSLLSYARARADLHRLRLPDGPMRRTERIVYLFVSLAVGPLAPSSPALPGIPYPATLFGVGFIAAGSALGAFLLVRRTRAALSPAPDPRAPSPAGASAPLATAENSRPIPPAC